MGKQTGIILGIAAVLIVAAGALFFMSGSNPGGGAKPVDNGGQGGAAAPAATAPVPTTTAPDPDAFVMQVAKDKTKLCFIDKSGAGQTFANFGADIYIPVGTNFTVIKKKAGTLKKKDLCALDATYLEQFKADLENGTANPGPLADLLGADNYKKLIDEIGAFGLKPGAFKKLAVQADCLEDAKIKDVESEMVESMK